MTDYSELKRLAEAAKKQYEDWKAAGEPFPTWNTRLMGMYAAANPPAVLELIAEVEYLRLELSGVETAKQDLAEILDCADEPRWKWLHCNASSLKAENEALRKDAGRYRWLQRQVENCEWMAGRSTITDKFGSVSEERVSGSDDMDQTIDAAMNRELDQ